MQKCFNSRKQFLRLLFSLCSILHDNKDCTGSYTEGLMEENKSINKDALRDCGWILRKGINAGEQIMQIQFLGISINTRTELKAHLVWPCPQKNSSQQPTLDPHHHPNNVPFCKYLQPGLNSAHFSWEVTLILWWSSFRMTPAASTGITGGFHQTLWSSQPRWTPMDEFDVVTVLSSAIAEMPN